LYLPTGQSGIHQLRVEVDGAGYIAIVNLSDLNYSF